MNNAQSVANLIEVGASSRAADGFRQRGVATDRDLRQRRSPLDCKLRAKISQRCAGQIQAPAKATREVQMRLVDHRGTNRPNVANISVVLTPGELLDGPWHLAPRLRRSRAGSEIVA